MEFHEILTDDSGSGQSFRDLDEQPAFLHGSFTRMTSGGPLNHQALSNTRERALNRPKPLWTLPPQGRAPTPHVANLRNGTIKRIASRALDATLPLIRVERLRQRQIPLQSLALQSLRNLMPKRRVQRRVLRPASSIAVHVPGAVFEFEGRARLRGVQGGEGVYVGVPGVGFVDVEGTRVDFVHAKAGVEVREGGYAGAYPAGGEGVGGAEGGVAVGAVVGVVDHYLVLYPPGRVSKLPRYMCGELSQESDVP